MAKTGCFKKQKTSGIAGKTVSRNQRTGEIGGFLI